jgi:hypothetical protein
MQGWSTLLNLPPAHQPTSFPKPSGVFQKLERIKTEVKLEHLIVYIVLRAVHKYMETPANEKQDNCQNEYRQTATDCRRTVIIRHAYIQGNLKIDWKRHEIFHITQGDGPSPHNDGESAYFSHLSGLPSASKQVSQQSTSLGKSRSTLGRSLTNQASAAPAAPNKVKQVHRA